MRLIDRGVDFGLREFAGELDQVGALLELNAHRFAPLIRAVGNAHHRIGIAVLDLGITRREGVKVAMTAGSRDQLARTENSRPLDFTFGLEPLEYERRIAVRSDVSYARNARLEIEGHPLEAAHHRFRTAGQTARVDDRVLGIQKSQVTVQIYEARHDRLAGDVIHDR